MVTYNEYLKGVLGKVIKSHAVLSGLGDVPGDLDVIKLELLKIKGFLQVIANKLDAAKYPSADIERLQAKSASYLESYYFEKEIENIASLYAGDSNRLKNLRLMILDSLNDKKLIEDIINLEREL